MLEDFERPAEGATLLHLAVGAASPEIVRFLLSRGLSPDERDAAGKSPHDLARMLWTVRPREANAIMDSFGTKAERSRSRRKQAGSPARR